MSVLNIVKMGHPILRKKADEVSFKDFSNIKKLVSDMKETLEFIGASGLAAPQVLVNKRIVVYRVNNNRIPKNAGFSEVPWTVMINPVIKPLSIAKESYWERCLSIPGLHGKVPRYSNILVEYYDLNKKLIKHEAKSTWAALIQHECDHLDGVLYPMRMKDFTKFGFNDTPGDISEELKSNKNSIDPLFIDLVNQWPQKNN
ncbi:MAG: Peptide deformylase [Alphaproteobacteria bacterium MarineAlpha9_Bin4]|nr:peptide deformylase [Pelagibacterales bacterium]PPR25467.1 MAG: Peptide deformylase [Alphaproteobacteria bacterium MarineAlpha9_Bin4]|tara:strand:+ start:202 stop:804 length:603 start_codon:yes stop_codon:yes gene_type:complete